MRRSLKFVFAVLLVLVFSSAALALSPQDALSARPGSPFYYVAGLEDLNGILQGIFSPANIEIAASFAPPEEAQIIRLLASFVAQIPARSVAVSFGFSDGADADLSVFLQLAASMPASVRPKLDRVADGTASGVEIVTLLLGDGGIMFSAGFMPEVHKTADGSAYYSFEDVVTFAAKDDLFLITLSLDDLTDSLNALAKRENRLSPKRRFNSPDFLLMHADLPATLALTKKLGQELGDKDLANGPKPEEMAQIFKAPFDFEMDFTSKPGSFLISSATNVMEAIADPTRYKDLKPSKEGGVFKAGGGKLLAVMSGPVYLRAEDLKVTPEVRKIWDALVKALAEPGITEGDLEDLLNGQVSIAFGSDATILGRRAPGGYIAITGREGAAAKVLGKIMGDEKFTQTITTAPLKAEGWDEVYMVDPSLVPMPLLFGRMGDTLFAGVMDSAALNKTPEVPAEISKMFDEPILAGGAVDFAGIWSWLGREFADVNSPLTADIPQEVRPLLSDVMAAELSVPLMKMWVPALEEAFMEFATVDVPSEKRLLPRLFHLMMALPGREDPMADDEWLDEDGMYEEEIYEDETEGQ